MQITIGDYLIERLKQVGITEVIGVPGDFNLQWLEQIHEAEGIRFVGTTNELNAAYAADGYARRRGISALLTTYGVGELSALNGIAGAAAEHVPVISIGGAPPLYATEYGYHLHHTMADGDFTNMLDSIAPFTEAAVRITPHNAAEEIDRIIHTALREKRPVHLQLPSDISYLTIEAELGEFSPAIKPSDPERLETAVNDVLAAFEKAENPLVLVDLDADRHGFGPALQEFAEKTGTRYAQMTTGKAILSENSPLFVGTYNGLASTEEVRNTVENADFLLTTTPRFIETNSGSFTTNLPEKGRVDVGDQHIRIDGVNYLGVTGIEALELLAKRAKKSKDAQPGARIDRPSPEQPQVEKPLTQARLWPRMAAFVQEGDVVFGEAGTSNIGVSGHRFPDNSDYITSNIWGAIGFTLPATFGSLLAAPERRHILFIGDGSFQLTVQELSTMLREGQKPVIVLLNNRGYTIERWILGMDRDYNDIANWQYNKLPEIFCPGTSMKSYSATTEGELEEALAAINDSNEGAFLELHLEPEDAPAGLQKFGPATAEFDYGPRGPRNP